MRFSSNGKILLSGEYLVLDGADSLALPSKLTQELILRKCDDQIIEWQSIDNDDNIWYEEKFYIQKNKFVYRGKKNKISEKLILLFEHILKTKKYKDLLGNKFITKLNFGREWGLGTSSTFVNNLAKWADVDPYQLLFSAFNGSGYDIACCDVNYPIIFNNYDNNINVEKTRFNPPFVDSLYLIYLEKKQNTYKSIKNYKSKKNTNKLKIIEKINAITNSLINCKDLYEFENLMEKHESIVSSLIGIESIQQTTFKDYKNGKIKSLGAWGGDFILVTSNNNDLSYFRNKGLKLVFPLKDLVYLD